ncbi:CoA-disulfide reductase [Litoribacter alkaliphilus]|uniref:CoA-disulfide reductase n=1 Tax=Litoribacter ruber TaxID=702568 RepID=A0AAP2CMN5_9BACT|nr:CoA-disulfide reductase [Litoribacter alkaliphilus]MBS9525375.1 CoA-disulfide reductase [Litoribacter alkaliphilus]
MNTKKVVIIGGVAGGATAAARLRRLSEQVEIVLFERGEHISFANCGLPYYIGGTIEERDKLLLQTPEKMSKKFNMDIRTRSEVVAINRERKTVTVKKLGSDEIYEKNYDKLILSPGAKPFVPTIKGLDKAPSTFTLRNIPDTDKIKSYINMHNPKHATVIGGGFIGLEMAENLHELGVQVSLVERSRQVMEALDFEMAAILQDHIESKGVKLFLDDSVEEVIGQGEMLLLKSGKTLETDLIILSAGVQPESNLAETAGLALGNRKTIAVNEFLQTSDADIYAVGDAIEVKDIVSGQDCFVPLAWPANRQGRIVADSILGKKTSYRGTLGTAIAKVFDFTGATTGNNEKVLQRLGKPYLTAHIHPNSHAAYYPGAKPMALKILFSSQDGSVYGAQGVGEVGVDKRIDVLATAIKGGLSVYDLSELELAYAPPYSSAKDPVNMLGYVSSNMLEENLKTYQWHEVDRFVKKGKYFLDVREKAEVESGMIKGAYHIPVDDIRERHNELPKDKTIHIYCHAGLRGYLAFRTLSQLGFNVTNLDGGFKTYQMAKKQLEKLNPSDALELV